MSCPITVLPWLLARVGQGTMGPTDVDYSMPHNPYGMHCYAKPRSGAAASAAEWDEEKLGKVRSVSIAIGSLETVGG